MRYNELTDNEYARRASEMIMYFEGYRSRPYDAGGDGMATIGFGYTFNRNNNVEMWDRAGINLSDVERRQLGKV